jgi:hypothetical protein
MALSDVTIRELCYGSLNVDSVQMLHGFSKNS